MTDSIDHPKHYTSRDIGYECIDIDKYQTFAVGNIIKYLWRYKDKGKPVEDLRKALWYAHLAKEMTDTVHTETGNCETVLRRLVESTTGAERSAWAGLALSDWPLVTKKLSEMIKEVHNDTRTD